MFENRLKPLYPDVVIAKSSTSIARHFYLLLKDQLELRGSYWKYQDHALSGSSAIPWSTTYNLAYLLRTLALPEEVEHRSLTTLREKLVNIGGKVVRHGRYVTFQLAQVAVPRTLFAEILRLIGDLRPRPAPT